MERAGHAATCNAAASAASVGASAPAVAIAAAAAAVAATVPATVAVSAALTTATAAAVAAVAAADVVQRYMPIFTQRCLPGRWPRFALCSFWRGGSVCPRHGLHRLRRTQ